MLKRTPTLVETFSLPAKLKLIIGSAKKSSPSVQAMNERVVLSNLLSSCRFYFL